MNVIRLFTFAVFMLVAAFTTVQTGSAIQSDSVDCGSFSGDQAAAQAYFEANGQPDALDGNGDGQACADPEDGDFTGGPSAGPGGPSAGPDVTCGSFNNDQAAAQAYFDANGQPGNLDGNGDGQACANADDGDFTSTGPSAGPEDDAASADVEADGETSEADDSNVVSSLPDTGSGSFPNATSSGVAILMALSAILGAGAVCGSRSIRR